MKFKNCVYGLSTRQRRTQAYKMHAYTQHRHIHTLAEQPPPTAASSTSSKQHKQHQQQEQQQQQQRNSFKRVRVKRNRTQQSAAKKNTHIHSDSLRGLSLSISCVSFWAQKQVFNVGAWRLSLCRCRCHSKLRCESALILCPCVCACVCAFVFDFVCVSLSLQMQNLHWCARENFACSLIVLALALSLSHSLTTTVQCIFA